jgi:hypothetical protein
MPEQKPLAIVHDYDGLLAALRARRVQLGVTLETVDEVGGFASRYASKLLAPHPAKNMGIMAMGALLGTLGLKLVVVEDDEALGRVRSRLVKAPSAGYRPVNRSKSRPSAI